MSAAPAQRRNAGEQTPRRDARRDRRCRRCGYGIATALLPSACPMCGGVSWEPVERRLWPGLDATGTSDETCRVLIAQLSDVHVGGTRYRELLLRTAIDEINAAEPDVVVVAGDLTDEGYPDQYPLAREELAALSCRQVVRVPGNHDARNVGYLHYEDTFGARDLRERLDCDGVSVALVAVDSSKPDLDEGEIGREHYGWIEEGFADEADLRVFVCHHHLVPVPGTGRERNQVLDAGDVLSLLRQCGVDLVLSGHRHVPYVWPIAGMLLVHSGTVSTLRTRGFPHPAYNLIRIGEGRISVELCVPGGERRSLGKYPRDWPAELSAREADPFVRAARGAPLADDQPTPPQS